MKKIFQSVYKWNCSCFFVFLFVCCFFFFKQKTAYEMCGRDWSSDVCSSDLSKRLEPWDDFFGSSNGLFDGSKRFKRCLGGFTVSSNGFFDVSSSSNGLEDAELAGREVVSACTGRVDFGSSSNGFLPG